MAVPCNAGSVVGHYCPSQSRTQLYSGARTDAQPDTGCPPSERNKGNQWAGEVSSRPSERRNELSVSRHNYVLPLLVCVEVTLVLRTIPGKFVVHAIRNSGGQHSLVIAKCLAHPDDKNIVLSDFLLVGRVNMRIEIINYGFNRNLHELLVIQITSPYQYLVGSSVSPQQLLSARSKSRKRLLMQKPRSIPSYSARTSIACR